MAGPIEMPFGLWTLVGPRKHVLDGAQIPPCNRAIIRRKDMPQHARRHSAMRCLKMAELIDLSFGLCTQVCVVVPMCPHWRAHWRHPANTIEPPVCGSDAALCQITLTTCLYWSECGTKENWPVEVLLTLIIYYCMLIHANVFGILPASSVLVF